MRILSNSKMEPKNTCTAKRFYSVCRRKKCMHICSILVGFPPFPHRVENGEKPEHMGISHSFHRVFHRTCECACLYIDMHMHD